MQLIIQPSRERLRYLEYCKNPFRDDAIVSAEFDELRAIPEVKHVAFRHSHTLMIGTSMISIKHPSTGCIHDVGEFIINLHRCRTGKVWETGFCFENIHGTIEGYHHPHIYTQDVTGFGNLGILCIQRGQFHIYQHLRSAEIPTATRLLLQVLKTYTASGPFRKLDMWPRGKGQ